MYEEFSLIQKLILWIPPVLFAIIIHEISHGVAALYFGDKTAKLLGRLTLNPFKHIDLIGTVIVPLTLFLLRVPFLFGWAKPVPVDYRNLKNPVRDMAIVALAGPLSNFIMALLWACALKIAIASDINGLPAFAFMAQIGIYINVVLGILNLFPVPPLDGSRILMALVPRRTAYALSKLEPYGFLIILLLFMSGILNWLMWPMVMKIFQLFSRFVGLE